MTVERTPIQALHYFATVIQGAGLWTPRTQEIYSDAQKRLATMRPITSRRSLEDLAKSVDDVRMRPRDNKYEVGDLVIIKDAIDNTPCAITHIKTNDKKEQLFLIEFSNGENRFYTNDQLMPFKQHETLEQEMKDLLARPMVNPKPLNHAVEQNLKEMAERLEAALKRNDRPRYPEMPYVYSDAPHIAALRQLIGDAFPNDIPRDIKMGDGWIDNKTDIIYFWQGGNQWHIKHPAKHSLEDEKRYAELRDIADGKFYAKSGWPVVATRDDIENLKRMIEFDKDCRSAGTSIDYYQTIATKSAIYPGIKTPLGLAYVALKLNGEAGELAEHVGKAMRDDGYIQQFTQGSDTQPKGTGPIPAIFLDGKLTPERRKAIIKEIGDVLWYLAAACNELGITLSEAALTNLEKLCDRGERGKLQGSGDER